MSTSFHDDILLSDDDFSECEYIKDLGQGTFGSVALYNTPAGECAIKESVKSSNKVGYSPAFLNELDTLRKFSAVEGIVNLRGVYFSQESGTGYILLENMDENLKQWFKRTPIRERLEHLPDIIRSIGEALGVMHSFSYIHNDIKPNNILVKDGKFKLADFGHSMHISNNYGQYAGLVEYHPPVTRNVYNTETWALMVVLIEVIIGKSMISSRSAHASFYKKHSSRRGIFNAPAFIRTCLTEDEFDTIPNEFWEFIQPLLSGAESIYPCLGNMGCVIHNDTLKNVGRGLSRRVDIDSRTKGVSKVYSSELCYSNGPYKDPKKVKMFENIMALFLLRGGTELDETDILMYGEVVLSLVLRGRLKRLTRFKNHKDFLIFQRALLSVIGYQIHIY